ncbi:MAG: hypothetical protein A2142_09275 [candidate division Zixibacteria bacterium RBG_16_48_11]|nr:MAG: hypothetical protein A2142_09275 [candidate division Zixibacteria bacterium RBG_16_48_11]
MVLIPQDEIYGESSTLLYSPGRNHLAIFQRSRDIADVKFSPKTIAFLQASGLTGYIGLFAVFALRMQSWGRAIEASEASHPFWAIILFLIAFVISALVSATLILGYPIHLFFDGRKSEALKIVFWSAAWLVVYLGIFVVLFALFFLPQGK